MISFLPVFAFSLAAGLPQAAPPQSQSQSSPQSTSPEPAPVYGPSHIQSDSLHLSFDLPDGIQFRKDLTDATNKKFDKKSPTGAPCTLLETIAFNPKILNRIYFYHFNGDCIEGGVTQERLRSVAAKGLTGILHASGKESMTSPLDFDMAAHPAAVMSGNVFSEANHGVLFGEMACAAVAKDIACWTFVSSTLSKTSRLAAMPVQFDGQPPAPIIPADISDLVALPTLTFHDDQRHIEFTYPGTFANAQPRAAGLIAKIAEQAPDNQKAAIECMKILLSADEITDTDRSNILIYRFDTTCDKIEVTSSTLGNVAKGMIKGIKQLSHSKISKPVPYKLAGHDAVLIDGTFQLKDKPEASMLDACVIVSGDILCWQLSSSSVDRAHKLAASPISFDSQLGVPLIPASLLPKPK